MFSVMLKSCLMHLYVGPCHAVSAEITVAIAVLIENPAGCELRGVIRFLQDDEILGYLAEDASSRVELFCCMTMHVRILPGSNKALLREQFHWDIIEQPPYSADLAPSHFFLFPKLKDHLAGKHFANDEDLKDAD